MIKACSEVGAQLVFIDNLYMYDPNHIGNLHEEVPVSPKTRKGRLRAEIASRYLKAHQGGECEILILRGSDFYGPGIRNAVMGIEVIENLQKGKKPYLLGNPDVLHSFTFIDDLAKAAVILGEKKNAYGEVWHAPTAPAISQKEFLTLFANELGVEPRYQPAKGWMLWLLGLFNPVIREVREMTYQFESDFIINDDKIRTLGLTATPPKEGIHQTIEWFKQQQ